MGERDLLGIGFSDNVIFLQQYYVRALLQPELELQLHNDESSRETPEERGVGMNPADRWWEFEVDGTGFGGRFRIELDRVPEEGEAAPLVPA